MRYSSRFTRPAFLAAAGSLAGIVVVKAPAKAAQFTYKLGHDLAETHPIGAGAKDFADTVKRESNGRIEILVFPNNQLGADPAMVTQVRQGALQLSLQSSGPLSEVVPIAGVERVGFAFKTWQQAIGAMDGDVGTIIRRELEVKHMIAFEKAWEAGFRQISCTPRPIRGAVDLEHLKIRVAISNITVDMFKVLGANPTPINAAELYTALQTKICDAADGAYINMIATKFYEVQKYLSVTNHQWASYYMIMNPDAYAALGPELQGIIRKASNEAGRRQVALANKENDAGADQLVKLGMIKNDADTTGFRVRLNASGFYERWKKEYGSAMWTALEKYTGKLG
jgi:tripartite ATP-independent transporter DctP family solute receptor